MNHESMRASLEAMSTKTPVPERIDTVNKVRLYKEAIAEAKKALRSKKADAIGSAINKLKPFFER